VTPLARTPALARSVIRTVGAAGACVLLVTALARPGASAQAPSVASQPQGQGAAPPSPREAAPVDLTGTWVSVVTEDWRWRMRTPEPGDTASVPLNARGQQVAAAWDPADDGRCAAYGAAGIMRMPGRLRISWQDDRTLKIETDAGQQTRLLRFEAADGAPAPSRRRSLQGDSVASWVYGRGAFDAFLERGGGPAGPRQWGSLTVRTDNLRAGWLRRNGVPYSQDATITEHFTRFAHPEAGDWFVVTTIVDDPQYLTRPFITSSNFRKEPDGATWNPVACRP
jgi:hypothetical protein